MARRTRLILAIILIILSCALLVWGLIPDPRDTFIQPIGPDQMQLPTPISFLRGFYLSILPGASPLTGVLA